MPTQVVPETGLWLKNCNGAVFEVVAIDREGDSVGIQYFDGAIEEYDIETWNSLELEFVEPPEDWSGSYDIEVDDYGVDLDMAGHHQIMDPLDELDKLR